MPIIHALTIPVPTQNSAKNRLALEMFAPPPKPPKSTRCADNQDEAGIDEAEKQRIEERDARFEDIKGNCRDCGEEFFWTAGEQGFYEDKGFKEGPKSCVDRRRKAKKLARMANNA